MTKKQKKIFLALAVTMLALAARSALIQIAYETNRPPDDNGKMDSVVIWVGPDPDTSVLYISDKTQNGVEMHDANTNQYIGRLGDTVSPEIDFSYPNGLAIAYDVALNGGTTDVLFVVERDTQRVTMVSVPDHKLLGRFGGVELEEPYGIALSKEEGVLTAWITETKSSIDNVIIYKITPEGNGLKGELDFQFATEGGLESIVIDEQHEKVYLSDEREPSSVMVYDKKGKFIKRIAQGLFVGEAEGVVIYKTDLMNGYLIVTDQNAEPTEFEVFDRASLNHIGHFSGTTKGTDGIALTQKATTRFPFGSFYAVHSDEAAHAYDWKDIATALGLQIKVDGDVASGVRKKQENAPSGFVLFPAYPNPGKPEKLVSFRIPRKARVEIGVYNIQGRKVADIADTTYDAGMHVVKFRTVGLATGTYVISMRSGGTHLSRSVVLIK